MKHPRLPEKNGGAPEGFDISAVVRRYKPNARNILAYLFTFAIVVIYAYVYNRLFGVAFITAFVLAPVSSVSRVLSASKKLSFSLKLNKRVFAKGENAEITLCARVDSVFSLPFCEAAFNDCVCFKGLGEGPRAFSVSRGSPAVIRKNAAAAVWGAADIGVSRVSARDFLGFLTVEWDTYPTLSETAYVCPAVFEPQKNDLLMYICNAIVTDDKEENEGDRASFLSQPGYTHRPYAPPDALNRINWKLLAKLDKLMVRENEYIKNENPRLVIDRAGAAGKGAQLLNERAVEACLAHLTSLVRENIPCDVFYFFEGAWQNAQIFSDEQITALSRELAMYRFEDGSADADRAPGGVSEGDGAFMFFTPRADAAGFSPAETVFVRPDAVAAAVGGCWAVNEAYDFYAV